MNHMLDHAMVNVEKCNKKLFWPSIRHKRHCAESRNQNIARWTNEGTTIRRKRRSENNKNIKQMANKQSKKPASEKWTQCTRILELKVERVWTRRMPVSWLVRIGIKEYLCGRVFVSQSKAKQSRGEQISSLHPSIEAFKLVSVQQTE